MEKKTLLTSLGVIALLIALIMYFLKRDELGS